MVRSRYLVFAISAAAALVAAAVFAPAVLAAGLLLTVSAFAVWPMEHRLKGSDFERINHDADPRSLFPRPQTGTPQATSLA